MLSAVEALGKLDSASDKVQKSTTKAEKGVNSLDDAFGKLNMSSLASVAGVSALTAAFSKMASSIGNFISSSVRSFAQFEGLQKSLGVTIGDVNEGIREFEELKAYANSTPYTVTGLADVASQLHAVGISTEETMDLLKRFGDVALGDSEKMQRIAANYAQIFSVGQTSAVDTKQFAMMGIPIYDMFKQIGVKGNASAEQVKQAFELMTDEGGKFFNGMEHGKDSLNVAFNQFSGQLESLSATIGSLFADEAKSGLSFITSAIQKIESIIGKLNEHPFLKALIAGTVVTALTTIAGVIVGAVIPAVMALVAAINPVGAGIGLAAGALTGLAGALGIVVAEQSMFNEKNDETTKSLEALRKKATEASDVYADMMKNGMSNDASMIETQIDSIVSAKEAELELFIKTFDAMKDGAYTDDGFLSSDYHDSERYKILQDEVSALKEQQNVLRNLQAPMLANLAVEKQITDEINKQNAKRKAMESIISKYKSADTESELRADLERLIAIQKGNYVAGKTKVENSSNINGVTYKSTDYKYEYYDKKDVDSAIAEIQKKLEKVSSNEWTWRTLFDRATGESTTYTGVNQNTAVTDYVNKVGETLQNQLKLSLDPLTDIMDKWGKSLYEIQLDEDKQQYNILLEMRDNLQSKYDQIFNSLKTTMAEEGKAMEDYPETLRLLSELGDKIDTLDYNMAVYADSIVENTERYTILSEGIDGLISVMKNRAIDQYGSGNDGWAVANQLGAGALSASSGSTASTMITGGLQGFELSGGNPIGAIVGVIISVLSSLESFISILEKVNQIISPILQILDAWIDIFTPIIDMLVELAEALQPLVEVVKAIFSVFKAFWQIVGKIASSILKVLKPVINLFSRLADAISTVVDTILGLFGISSEDDDEAKSAADEEAKLREKQNQVLEALNKQMESMTKTIKDQINYYYDMQKSMRSAFLNEAVSSGSLIPVNDMILTPQGKFSTSPDDYIIASKHPENLGGGNSSVSMSVVVNNTMASDANVTAVQGTGEDGMPKLLVTISKKIASDVATGSNGWDNAIDQRNRRISGRRIG